MEEAPKAESRKPEAVDSMGKLAQLVVLQVLRAYKWAISPMFLPACRYVPTCSEYAMEAVDRYGVLRGGWMTLWRLLRCHPFVRGGYDPVVRTSHSYEKQGAETHCHHAI
jgi:putative membrane protein insertion efficiency factor